VTPGPPAAGATAVSLLALASLGLTWARRTTEGPLGGAGDAATEALVGRDLAPVVAALVPAVTALAVVALLLRGRWRLVALVPATLVAGTAAALALEARRVPTVPGERWEVTAVPGLAVALCALAAALTALAAVATLRGPAHAARGSGGGSGRASGGAPSPATTSTGASDAELWERLDAGVDPTEEDGPVPRP
jgi:hypothetical protein